MSLRVVFMGSPDFALPSLRRLAEHYDVVGVVTQPDRAAGRGREMKQPPVKQLAAELGLPVIQPERMREPGVWETLQSWQPDLIVVTAFGQILRQNVLDLPRYGCVNVHASLLPRWRGAAPIQAALLNGDAETGNTIMRLDAGVDTGPMLAQERMAILAEDNAATLSERLAEAGADLLVCTLPDYLAGKITPQPQPAEGASYASMLKKEDGLLDFTLPAGQLLCRVRAFNPWPGAFFSWQGAPMKVLRASVLAGDAAAPGRFAIKHNYPAVGTPDGWLVLEEVQPAGKKAMSGDVFLRGARQWAQE